jgi:hypothetical protein
VPTRFLTISSSAQRALDQPFVQAALSAQLLLDPSHVPAITFVIVPEEVKETMKGEHANLSLYGMAGGPGLAARNAGGDGDLAKRPGIQGGRSRWKRQHIRRYVVASVPPVERADAGIGQERDCH